VPTTTSGRWAGRLLGLAALLFAGFFGLVGAGQRGGDTFFSNPSLSITMLGAAGAAMVAGAFGLHAVCHRDRSAVVIGAIVVATVVGLWTALEIAFPH